MTLQTFTWVTVTACTAACSGAIGGGDPAGLPRGTDPPGQGGANVPPPVPPPTGLTSAAPATVRRLTATELRNTISDVFLAGAPFSLALDDSLGRGFRNDNALLSVTEELVSSLQTEAERAAAMATTPAALAKLLPCAADTKADEACAKEFLSRTGRRAWRRPLSPAEEADQLQLYRTSRDAGDPFAVRIANLIEALIQSPNFLFRTELGDGRGKSGIVNLTPFETAAALSYYAWRAPPDDALLERAASGKLLEAGTLMAEARRLFSDPRAQSSVEDFVMQWLHLGNEAELAEVAPEATPALGAAMVDEVRAFVDEVVVRKSGGVAELLTAPIAFANQALGKAIGLPASQVPAGSSLTPITGDIGLRAGLLGRPAFIASNFSGNGTTPIFVGKQVRVHLLCHTLPPPPPGIGPPTLDPNLSTRDLLASHREDPSCVSCHTLMDPIGFGFEQLDVFGRVHTSETRGGKQIPLTGQGALHETDVDGEFQGPVELGIKLAASDQVQACARAQMLRYALGRQVKLDAAEEDSDGRSLAGLLDAGDSSVLGLLAEVAVTDAFRFRDARAVPALEGARP